MVNVNATQYVRNKTKASLARLGLGTFKGTTVKAWIERGAWIAGCPCNGAEWVAPGLEMLCGSCGAIHNVEFPPKKQVAEIDAVLSQRSDPKTRNWYLWETVDDLKAENIEMGVWEGVGS